MGDLRWKLTIEDGGGQGSLFADEELVERHVGGGEYRGLEFLHVNARRIINEVPGASRMPFRYTINPYRGCSHACGYCLSGETPILMADGRTKPMAEIAVGDEVYGTVRIGAYRRYVSTPVLAHWSTVKPAYRVTLQDGTELVASGDHRFLTDRGWKHVTGAEHGLARRPHLTASNKLMGVGHLATAPKHDREYRLGYLCGMIRGDGHLGSYSYVRPGRAHSDVHRFRLALADFEALQRTHAFLLDEGLATTQFLFQQAAASREEMRAIRVSSKAGVTAIAGFVRFPTQASEEWCKGFLAGIFDAEGSYSRGVLRIANTDPAIIDQICTCLRRLRFPFSIDRGRISQVRIVRGLQEHLRFFHTVDPAITRKRIIDGVAIKSNARLGVVGVESMGIDMPMHDVTTGTGDFIADGVVSHNCFARPTHEYLGLGIGEDFDTKLVVKVNAVERLRAELAAPRWGGDHIAMGTNTDPYQRCEAKFHLTRGIVGVLGDAGNPFSILTKSTLILRDLDLLRAAAARTEVRANFSIGTLDEDVWKATEPATPHPRRRVEAVAKLNQAGIPCGVLVAPVLPSISDSPEQLGAVVRACAEAGAVSISALALHLRPGVKEHFMAWLEANRPELVEEYQRRYRRAYLPKKEQEELSARVRGLVGASRGRFNVPSDTRPVGAERGAKGHEGSPPAGVTTTQLGLGV
jgi:DNA repair photolyase